MRKTIIENGLEYTLVGDYFLPNLALPEEYRPIGKWGRLHREYLKTEHPVLFNSLALSGRLWTHLAEFDEDDIIPYRHYEIVPCTGGFSFELGCGHEVELIHLGGHSAGSCGFLDKRNRCFFAGDDIISMRVGVFGGRPGETCADRCTVSTMRDNFEALSKRLDEFDHVYSGHFVTKLENTAVTAMLEACRAICADPIGNSSFSRDGQHFRYVEGLGTIAYSEKSV